MLPGMDVDDEVLPAIEETDEEPPTSDVFIPGLHTLGEDEVLEADEATYILRHGMGVDWPCLSFDVLRDNLGDERQRYPATAYIVAGSQALSGQSNQLSVFKMSSLHKTQRNSGKFLDPLHANIVSHAFEKRIQMMRTMRTTKL